MKRLHLLLLVAPVALAACNKEHNPLIGASDEQFALLIAPRNAFSPSCGAALYDPDAYVREFNGLKFSPSAHIKAVSQQQRSECIGELAKRAREIGIVGDVTAENLQDERVKQRYLASKKK